MHYPVVVHKDEESAYGVIVPDIPGCFSAGGTYEEALENVREAIECHIEGLLIDHEPLPIANEIDHHLHVSDYEGGIWALVEIDLSQLSGKAKRVNITLPERVLRAIDVYAEKHYLKNRSAFIANAALSYIAHDYR